MAGFGIETALQSDFNKELYWFIAKGAAVARQGMVLS